MPVFFLVIATAVLLHDAMREAAPQLGATQQVREVANADDALLVATTGDEASGYMRCARRAGLHHGLSTGENWKFYRRGATRAS